MHLNDVRILSQEMAKKYPRFEPGDLLLSFRSLNGVGVLDPRNNLFKWFYIGAVHHQHSPRFQGENRVLVFDNRGGRNSRGKSRIVAIDISDGSAKTIFPIPDDKKKYSEFFSRTAGHIDVHPQQERMLVSWTHQGLVWEIDIESGKVLWEYINTHKVGDRYGRIWVCTSLYITDLEFEVNGGQLP
jgi:hypothetical protein